jgi:lipoyl(octanoyl) transferase
LRRLEQVVISAAAALGVQAGRIEQPGYTGVWVGGAKVAAIGLKVSRWVTTHGVSVNVNPDMRYFRNIVPCGISDADKRVGALREFNESVTMETVVQALQEHFLREMGVTAGSTRRGGEAAAHLRI